MAIEIKLSDAETSAIIDRVKSDLHNYALNEAKAQIDIYMRAGQFIGEIRNIVAKECVAELKAAALRKFNDEKLLNEAVANAEKRLNQYIHTNLKKGLIVKFDLGEVE